MPKPLTPLAIAQMKPGKNRREVADAAFPGLSIIVHPSGQKTWTFRYRYSRRLRRITIGNFPAIDQAKARRRAETALGALERGEDPTIALFAPKSSQYILRADRDSFGVLIRDYFKKHAVPNTKSWRETARLLGLRVAEEEGKPPSFTDVHGGIVERFAERPVSGITRRDLRDMIEASRERGATTTINREVAAVRGFLQWCVNSDIIENNPAAGMAKASPENKRTRVLTDKELRVIWLAAESEAFPFGDIVRLLLLTGQRRGEVAGAAWSEFNLKAREWLLPAERSKNGLPHLIPLSDPALAILRSIPRFAGGDFMFGLGGRSGFSGFSKAKRRLDETIAELADRELPEWDLHDLRRSVATGMAKLGMQPVVIEACLNHVTGVRSSIASVYNLHSYETEKREALTRWAEHVEKIVDPDAEQGGANEGK
jgi:integrase